MATRGERIYSKKTSPGESIVSKEVASKVMLRLFKKKRKKRAPLNYIKFLWLLWKTQVSYTVLAQL